MPILHVPGSTVNRTKLYTVAVFLLGMFLSLGIEAHAIPILLNPGPIGPTPQDLDIPFNDLIGTPVSGQSLSLNFRFSGGKHIYITRDGEPALATAPFILVLLRTSDAHTAFRSHCLPGTVSLLDKQYGAISPPLVLFSSPCGTADGGVLTAFAWTAFGQPNPLFAPYDFYGADFEVTLLNLPGVYITGGSFMRVGNSSRITTTPELSSLVLIALGLCGLLALRLNSGTTPKFPTNSINQ